MSTNFGWHVMLPTGEPLHVEDDPQVHIGKRSADGEGRLRFTWAQDPEKVRAVLAVWKRRATHRIVVDEYGQMYTAEQFLAVLDTIDINDVGSVGRRFS